MNARRLSRLASITASLSLSLHGAVARAQQAPAAPSPAAPAAPWTAFASTDRGVGLTRADGLFGIAAHLFVQSRLDLNITPSGTDSIDFRVPVVRPQLRGNVLRPWITFFVQPELAGAPRLLDAEVTVSPSPWFGVRFGQFIPPFTRQFLTPPFKLLFSDFAMSNTVFRVDRSRGLELFGQAPSGHFEWHAAVTDANTIAATANEADHVRLYGRVAFTPWGRNAYTETPGVEGLGDFFTVGLNATWATVNRPTSTDAMAPLAGVGTTSAGLDLALHAGPVFAQAEGYVRGLDDAQGSTAWSAGGYGEAGVTVVPRRVELAARGDVLAANVSTGAGLTRRAEGLVAAYFDGIHLKAQLRYAYTDADPGSPVAPVGSSHQLSLQTQLFF
ncbi:MAG: porin [Polyangiales bacterium]